MRCTRFVKGGAWSARAGALCRKCPCNPVHDWRRRVAAQPDDIEAARMICKLPVPAQVDLGRAQDAFLFGRPNGLDGTPEARGASIANFDEHQRAAVQHHQIEFADSTIEVTRDSRQAVGVQHAFGVRFAVRTRGARRRAWWTVSAHRGEQPRLRPAVAVYRPGNATTAACDAGHRHCPCSDCP